MTELAFISLKTMDGKPCGFARLSGGFAEIRLLESLAGQAAVLTDGGVFSGVAGSRIAFSGRVLAVALHRDGRLLCMGLPRGAAITPDRIRAQLIPELTPTPYHPPREAQAEPVRESVERRAEPVRELADRPAQPTLAGQEKADPSMSAARREVQRTVDPMRADAEPSPKEETARAVKAARQPQADMDGGASGQSPGTAPQTAAAGRSENSAPNAQETAADTESFMALLRRADRAFAAVMHREPPAIPPAAQTGGMRRSARYEVDGASHTTPRSERADAGMTSQVGFDGASRETYAPRATPRSERAGAGMADQVGFDGASRETYAPRATPHSERVDAEMAGQDGVDGASRETYAPRATPRSERTDAEMADQDGFDGASRETYAPRATPHSERVDAGMADRDTPDGAAMAVQGTPLLNGRRLYTGLHGAAGEWCEEVERLLDNAPSDNRGEPIANPFPNIFPGAKFLRIRKPGVPTYLCGDWRSGHGAAGERMRITAVPGAYSPHPPAHLIGFTRYIRARSGGYWIRVEEWNEP